MNYFNLGIEKNWHPKHMPLPNKSKNITIDCLGKSKQEILYECINSTYDIMEDDHRLRKSISDFEKQRAEYPVRREFNYFEVHLNNADESINSAIGELGFNLKIKY